MYALTQISNVARLAEARIMRRKKTTFERSCHSGWSKNVRSCIVTTHGTGARNGIV